MRAWFATLFMFVWSAPASADEDRIALVAGDRELEGALRAALAPAGFRVAVISEEGLRRDDPIAAARDATVRGGASAAVWLVDGEDGASRILVYDRDVDRVLARPLGYARPLTATQAAEAARMVRTMLRALRVTPDIDAAPPRADEAPAVRAAAIAETEVRAPSLTLAAGTGLRFGGDESGLSWRIAGAVVWYPRNGAFGAAVSVAAGPAGDLEVDGARARFADDALAATMRFRPRGRGRIVEVGVGGALHRTVFESERLSDGGALEHTRFDPAVRAEMVATLRISAQLSLALAWHGDVALRRARYLDGAQLLHEAPAFQSGLSLLVQTTLR